MSRPDLITTIGVALFFAIIAIRIVGDRLVKNRNALPPMTREQAEDITRRLTLPPKITATIPTTKETD